MMQSPIETASTLDEDCGSNNEALMDEGTGSRLEASCEPSQEH